MQKKTVIIIVIYIACNFVCISFVPVEFYFEDVNSFRIEVRYSIVAYIERFDMLKEGVCIGATVKDIV